MNILDGGTVSNAERIRWQHRAAAELAAVLEEGEGLTPISWTVSPLGLMLTGRINGLVPADRVRTVFDQWRRLLQLDEVLETGPATPSRTCGPALTGAGCVSP